MPSIFSQEALSKIVAESLPPDPEKNHAIVGTVDQHGAQVVAGFKFKDGKWELQGAARHEWTGEDSVGAKVLLKW